MVTGPLLEGGGSERHPALELRWSGVNLVWKSAWVGRDALSQGTVGGEGCLCVSLAAGGGGVGGTLGEANGQTIGGRRAARRRAVVGLNDDA